MRLPVVNIKGEEVDTLEVSQDLFGVPMNGPLVHQVMVAMLANRRAGTASTKTRGEVSGGGRKPWSQKYTGRARQGSIRAPHWKGGGVVFGPKPRDYHQKIPKKMRRLALKCLLSAKAREGRLTLVDHLSLPAPKTKEMIKVLSALGSDGPTLIVTREPEPQVIKSAANLQKVKTLPVHCLNLLDLLTYDRLVMTVAAVRRAEELWAGGKPDG